MQRRHGSNFKTWGRIPVEGHAMPWLLTGHGSLFLEEYLQQATGRMRLPLFTFLTQVRTLVLSFRLDGLQD